MSFGRNPLWGLAKQQKVVASFSEIVLAATTLSTRRTGALIVIERLHGLRNYIENGISLDAVVSYDLLINIFQPDTPLHDGAVIIQDDRIAAASCFLPLTPNPELSKEFGTRHRAALGPHRGDGRRGRGGLGGDGDHLGGFRRRDDPRSRQPRPAQCAL